MASVARLRLGVKKGIPVLLNRNGQSADWRPLKSKADDPAARPRQRYPPDGANVLERAPAT